MMWFAISFFSAFVGAAFIGPFVPPALTFPLYIVAFIALLASGFLQKYNGASQILSIVIPLILGIILFPTLAMYVSSGAAMTVIMAAAGTFVIFVTSALAGWFMKRDLSSFAPILFGLLIGAIAISFLNAFIFKLAWLAVFISFVVIGIMVLYIYMTIQRVRVGGGGAHPSSYSLNLFVSIYNIFVSLLQILGIFRN